ncbi:type 1 periplasmic-binding domain-containing protein [Geobacillus thermoleovorans]|uniref:hypothetical protein n=1 Tax=Geobacillus thermoleovorans TaxID=33941 RepID=UPI00296EFAA7
MGGIPKEALRYGYQLLLVQTNYDVERELEALERLRMRQMDGLIVCSREVGWEAFAAYQEDGPIVFMRTCQRARFSCCLHRRFATFSAGRESVSLDSSLAGDRQCDAKAGRAACPVAGAGYGIIGPGFPSLTTSLKPLETASCYVAFRWYRFTGRPTPPY